MLKIILLITLMTLNFFSYTMEEQQLSSPQSTNTTSLQEQEVQRLLSFLRQSEDEDRAILGLHSTRSTLLNILPHLSANTEIDPLEKGYIFSSTSTYSMGKSTMPAPASPLSEEQGKRKETKQEGK